MRRHPPRARASGTTSSSAGRPAGGNAALAACAGRRRAARFRSGRNPSRAWLSAMPFGWLLYLYGSSGLGREGEIAFERDALVCLLDALDAIGRVARIAVENRHPAENLVLTARGRLKHARRKLDELPDVEFVRQGLILPLTEGRGM